MKFEACNKHGETPWNVGVEASAYQEVIKKSPAQTVETIKMVRFTFQFIEIKSGRNVLDCVLITKTEKQQALGKHPTAIARLGEF